jgi:hypothetical protein
MVWRDEDVNRGRFHGEQPFQSNAFQIAREYESPVVVFDEQYQALFVVGSAGIGRRLQDTRGYPCTQVKPIICEAHSNWNFAPFELLGCDLDRFGFNLGEMWRHKYRTDWKSFGEFGQAVVMIDISVANEHGVNAIDSSRPQRRGYDARTDLWSGKLSRVNQDRSAGG